MASLNGKSTEDSSSNEDSADKSDEADIQELAEDEIQEAVEDAQETVKGGVQEAIYQRSAGERSSDTNLITCWYTMYIFLISVIVVWNDGVPPRLSNVLITGIPFNDSKEFKTWNFGDIQTIELKHSLASRLIHKHNHWLCHYISSCLNKIIKKEINWSHRFK